jgi:hypothetical protein
VLLPKFAFLTDGDGGVALPWYLRSVTARHQRVKLFLLASTLWQRSQLTRCTCVVTWVDHMGLWPEGTSRGSWPSREHVITIVHVASGIQVRAVLEGEDSARSNAMSPANLSTKSAARFRCRGIGSDQGRRHHLADTHAGCVLSPILSKYLLRSTCWASWTLHKRPGRR